LFTGSYSNIEPHRSGGTASVPGTQHEACRAHMHASASTTARG
jgi:hypothetical protein